MPDFDQLAAYDFELPEALIARYPAPQREESRLMVVERSFCRDALFADLPTFLSPGDLLVFNDSRVIHARLFGEKPTGGAVEVLFERLLGPKEALALIRASKSPKPGATLRLANAFAVEVVGRAGELYHLRLIGEGVLLELIERYGQLPIPPYLGRSAEACDEIRYQTVYARTPGSVAAPTAGLHFSPTLLTTLAARGVRMAWVTLHVGAATFQPVRSERVSEHAMHSERFVIPKATVAEIEATRMAGRRVIAVGTTTLRTLEGAAALWGELRAGSGETNLFIRPGFTFRVVDGLITNFHLPRSTLLILVCAFGGYARIRAAYQHAIAHRYRFFSYGDAMFLPARFADEEDLSR